MNLSLSRQHENGRIDGPGQGAGSRQRIQSLQGLRAIAFLGIFLSHSRLRLVGVLGNWGVSVFFVLSGFLMMFNYYPREKQPEFGFRFAWNKIRQLYPLHLITMLLSAVYALLEGSSPGKTLLDVVLHTFLLQIWIPSETFYATLNGPAWYLCAAFFCYLCFPLILRFFKRSVKTEKQAVNGILLLFAAELLLSGLTLLAHRHEDTVWFNTHWITYYFPPVRLIDFTMGCFLGAIFLFRGRVAFRGKSSLRFSCLTLGMLILPFFFLYLLNQAQPFKAVKYTLLFLPSSMALIWTLLDPKGLFSRLLSCRPFVWLGNLSPYTFLIHLVAIRYVCLALPGMEARFNLLLVLLSFLVTVAGAILYQKAVNARKLGRRTPPAAERN